MILSLKKKIINVYSLKIIEEIDSDHTKFIIKCGSGTYVRSLAHDLSIYLGTYGHAEHIKRIRDNFFTLGSAVCSKDIFKLNKEQLFRKLKPVSYVLKNFNEYEIEKKYADKLKSGKVIYLDYLKNETSKKNGYILIFSNKKLVSIANLQKGYIIPRRNFNN